jgi:mannitol-1-/sugar-/sorbitol-6-phosphatase
MADIRCRGVLFDLDGVLVDSTAAIARVWAGWARAHGFDPEQVTRKAHGRPSIATIVELLPDADHAAEDREVERREMDDIDGVVALPGAIDLLRSLPGDRWAIVTSCSRPLAAVRIGAAGLPKPKYLVTSTDVSHGKPDPEPYLKGAQLLGLDPADCVVLDDAPAGIRAGKSAGARVAALRTTESETALREAGADWIVKDCSDLHFAATKGSSCDDGYLLLSRRSK